MTVGLAFFYGGLVRPKNALNTMMMSVVALGLISVQWVLVGYSIAFGHGSPLWGGLAWLGFRGVGGDPDPAYAATIPLQAHAMFQLMFAIITPAPPLPPTAWPPSRSPTPTPRPPWRSSHGRAWIWCGPAR